MSELYSSTVANGTQHWKVKLLCPMCRKMFEKAQKLQRYCSPACRKKAWAVDKKNTAACPICQTLFVRRRPQQTYCNPKCRWAAWLNRKVESLLVR